MDVSYITSAVDVTAIVAGVATIGAAYIGVHLAMKAYTILKPMIKRG